MVDLSIDVPQRDLIEFRRIMGLLQTKLGKTPEKAVEIGAAFVAKSLQAATRVSKKQRYVYPADRTHTGRKSNAVWRKWFAVDDRIPGQPKQIPIHYHYKTKEEAQKQLEAQIYRSGLARLLWWKAAKKIGSSVASQPAAAAAAMQQSEGLMIVTKIMAAEQSSISMNNSSRYALMAFKSSGRATVDDSMRRAANSMRKFIERQTGDAITQRNMT